MGDHWKPSVSATVFVPQVSSVSSPASGGAGSDVPSMPHKEKNTSTKKRQRRRQKHAAMQRARLAESAAETASSSSCANNKSLSELRSSATVVALAPAESNLKSQVSTASCSSAARGGVSSGGNMEGGSAARSAKVKGVVRSDPVISKSDDFPALGGGVSTDKGTRAQVPGLLRLKGPLPAQCSKSTATGGASTGGASALASTGAWGTARTAADVVAQPRSEKAKARSKPGLGSQKSELEVSKVEGLGDLVAMQLARSKKKRGAPGPKAKGLAVTVSRSHAPKSGHGSNVPKKNTSGPSIKGVPASGRAGNTLDSSAPVRLRGKERETPKKKKPSVLKQKIIAERETKAEFRKWLNELGPCDRPIAEEMEKLARNVHAVEAEICRLSRSELMDSNEETIEVLENDGSNEVTQSADESPAERMARLALYNRFPLVQSATTKFHSRNFREYCTQVKDKELDSITITFLERLSAFQTRAYQKDPLRAKAKRRMVVGLREVSKQVQRGKIKAVLVAPDIERIQSEGGLDDILLQILDSCAEQTVPTIFCLHRRLLGRSLKKPVPVSIVGIRDYQGAQDLFEQMMARAERAAALYLAYRRMAMDGTGTKSDRYSCPQCKKRNASYIQQSVGNGEEIIACICNNCGHRYAID